MLFRACTFITIEVVILCCVFFWMLGTLDFIDMIVFVSNTTYETETLLLQ